MLSNANASEYKQLSKFTSTTDLNNAIRGFLYKYKYELNDTIISIYRLLANHSIKFNGISFMKHSTIAKEVSKSIATVKRSLKALSELQAIEIHRTSRTKGKVKGGYGHNVFIICDLSNELSEMNHRENEEKPCEVHNEPSKNTIESSSYESSNLFRTKDSNNVMNNHQDTTYLPSFIPESFIKSVQNHLNTTGIYHTWKRVQNAYSKFRLNQPIQTYIDLIAKTFRQAVFMQKQGKIRKTFMGYFYTGLISVFQQQYRKEQHESKETLYYDWLES